MALDSYRVSLQGDRRVNQDRCEIYQQGEHIVLVLGDGLGGHPRGEVASQLLVDACHRVMIDAPERLQAPHDFIEAAMTLAQQQIMSWGLKQVPPVYPRTTVVLALIHHQQLYWTHLGDSRLYLFRHGRAHLRTLDHSQAERARLMGKLDDIGEQSEIKGRSAISRCLGGTKRRLEFEISGPMPLQADDLLLLCSDGIWAQLGEQELEAAMLTDEPLAQQLTELAQQAVTARFPNSDNATALALRWQPPQPAPKEGDAAPADTLDEAIGNLQDLINRYGDGNSS